MQRHEVIDRKLGDVSFAFYTSEELKKLSVLQVTDITPFDELGHATPGGLYDERLGPSRRYDICATCRSTEDKCEGHTGHIVLPLPVMNPVLMPSLETLMRFTCLKCLHLRVPLIKLETHIIKLQILDYGLDYLVDEFEKKIDEETEGIEETENLTEVKIPRLWETALSLIREKGIEKKSPLNIKSTVEKKKHLLRDFWTRNLGRSCPRCMQKSKSATLNSRTFFMLSDRAVRAGDEDGKKKDSKGKQILTKDVKELLRQLWKNEEKALRVLFPFLDIDTSSHPTDVFFWDVLNVAPPRYQPLRLRDDRTFVHERRAALIEIMKTAEILETEMKKLQSKDEPEPEEEVVISDPEDSSPPPESGEVNRENEDSSSPPESEEVNRENEGGKENQKLAKAKKVYYVYNNLQTLCNTLYNSEMNKKKNQNPGVIQGLEKKEGLFRNNMMGKRVNFAARTVISPDPYITANELGIPVIFALKLTYPQNVTPFNLKTMQKAILNGPDVHPGAVAVRMDDGFVVRLKDPKQRKIMSERMESAIHRKGHPPVVYRHLVSGDVVLFNRQPTLHKPSIMAHIARVLPGEKTFRMHYSNCKAYNADFDGDEMNVHFPQSELARAEAYEIASVNQQYLTPKDGSPLSGLIQDHIVAAALLSVRGTFFSRDDYHELVYGSLSFLNQEIRTVPPAIVSPKRLWTGKQLITTLIMNVVPKDSPLPTVTYPCKVKPKAFVNQEKREYSGHQLKPEDMCESQVVILRGEHLSGIIDKSSIGNQQHGLIHVCYEIYGGQVSTNLLTAFARLSTNYLQCHVALTLGIEDILVTDRANQKRMDIIQSSKYVGRKAILNSIASDSEVLTDEMIREKMRAAHTDQQGLGLKILDSGFKGETDEVNNQISSVCLDGLKKKFPDNNLQLMIQSGAKGGTVNALQISCLLGQIELEGRRVPLMMSGKTLPSFVPYDTTPRAGGFIAGRFLTGIRPQEFFFHCMAGREGLVDTAVKTASSGYLQRCIIKHMEGLMVNYDMTVRDADGSVIQFLYGEDGLDVTKSQLISPSGLPILIRNRQVLQPTDQEMEKIRQDLSKKRVAKQIKKIKKWERFNGTDRTRHVRGSGFLHYWSQRLEQTMETDDGPNSVKEDIVQNWRSMDQKKKTAIELPFQSCPDPINTVFRSDQLFGTVSERIERLMQNYVRSNPDNLLTQTAGEKSISPLVPDVEHESTIRTFEPMTRDDFFSIYCHRHMRATCEPGEPVGVLVGHSIGEPSTQMTLNTFHFAGRGEMNVTLGIPRLREILMHASDHITTPSMDIPFRSDIEVNDKVASAVRLQLNAVKLSDVLQEVEIKESLIKDERSLRLMYEVKFEFLRYKYFKKTFNATPPQILTFMEDKFIPLFRTRLHLKIKFIKSTGERMTAGKDSSEKMERENDSDDDDGAADAADQKRRDRESAQNAKKAVEDEDDDMSSGDEAGDGDTLSSKRRAKHNEETDFQEPEEDEEEKEKSDSVNDDDDGEDSDKESDEEGNNASKSDNGSTTSDAEKQRRIAAVLQNQSAGKGNAAGVITEYDFDDKNQKWCRLVLMLDLDQKLDVSSLIKETADSCFVHKVGQIRRAFLVKDSQAGEREDGYENIIKTEGVSFLPLVRFIDTLDLNRVYSNDIQSIAKTYGIEAGGQAIRREIRNVFAVYGIAVDPRHLSLISDYMTFSGEIRGMNRRALSYNSSPIQQMSFESTSMFMKDACLTGLSDNLSSPSACIFAGVPPKLGTGCFDVLPMPVTAPQRQKQPFGRKSMSSIKWTPDEKAKKRRSRIVIPVNLKKIKFE